MADMLVDLLKLQSDDIIFKELEKEEIQIRRAMVPDKHLITKWVAEHFTKAAADEMEITFARQPVSSFIATRGNQILGYACYEATNKNFFGPTGVLSEERNKGIGKALLLESLKAMRDQGYAYAIIGGVGPKEFYMKCVGAFEIPNSTPGIYKDFIAGMK